MYNSLKNSTLKKSDTLMSLKNTFKKILFTFSLFCLSLSFSQAYALEVFEGTSSWYGPGFHTRTTANGEKYDMYGISAAHRTLPFETLLRVTHLKNKRMTVIRINDRGPVAPVFIMDLSHGAAMALNMVDEGTAKVRMELVGTKKGLLTKDEVFFLNLDDTIVTPDQDLLLRNNNTGKENIYYADIVGSLQVYNKINKNLGKLYQAGIQNATELLISIDNSMCLGPFKTFLETEKYYFRIVSLYPHASIWLKPKKDAIRLIINKTKE